MKKLHYLLLFLVITSCGLLKKTPINQKDAEGKRTGRWISYWNDSLKIKMYDGCYANDRETKTCRYYHQNGKPSVTFKYDKTGINVKFREPDGRLIQKGRSVINYTKDSIAYYYNGKWKFYDEQGKLQKVSVYEMGVEKYLLKERLENGKMFRYHPPKKLEETSLRN